MRNFFLCDHEKLMRDVADIKYCQSLIMDYVLDVRDSRKAVGALREFQLKDVELFRILKEICDDNALDYWLCFGSLLGAYRHGGFIPWDNDLDVGMMKPDFDKLRKLKVEFEKRGANIIDHWVEGKMARVVFSDKVGPFVDIYAFIEDGDVVSPLPPWGASVRYGLSLPRSFVLPCRKDAIEFEGIKANTPNQVERCLRFYYGDYMTFPKHGHSAEGHILIDSYSEIFA